MANEHNKKNKLQVVLFILIIIFYLPSLVLWFYSDKIQTGLLYNGEIKEVLNVDLLVFKDEKVEISNREGVLYKICNEGEKYPSGSEIAYVLDKENSDLISNIQDLNNRILKKQYDSIKNRNINSSRLSPIILKEKNIIISLAKYYEDTVSLNDVNSNISELNSIIKEKINILNKLIPQDDTQKELFSEKEKLQNSLINQSDIYFVTEPGFISFTYDGYETILTKDKIYDFTVGEFEEVMKKYTGYSENDINISNDSPVYKNLVPQSIYYSFLTHYDYSEYFEENKDIVIDITGNETISSNVKNITKDEKNKKILVFLESNMFVKDIQKLRILNAELTINNTKGIKVDIKSLVNIDEIKENAYIFLAKANYARLVKIKINAINKNFAIIEGNDDKMGLDLYDTYIINPKNINDGQQIDS